MAKQSSLMQQAIMKTDIQVHKNKKQVKPKKKTSKFYRRYINENGKLEVTFRIKTKNYGYTAAVCWDDKFRFDNEENVKLYMEQFEEEHKQFLIKIIKQR